MLYIACVHEPGHEINRQQQHVLLRRAPSVHVVVAANRLAAANYKLYQRHTYVIWPTMCRDVLEMCM